MYLVRVDRKASHIGTERRGSVLLTLLEKALLSPRYSQVISGGRLAPSGNITVALGSVGVTPFH